MRKLSYKIAQASENLSVGAVLRNKMNVSRTVIARAKKSDTGICLNGERVFTTAKVKEGDILTVEILEKENPAFFKPISHPLDILYEDEDLLIINKEAGMSVYADKEGQKECALANAVSYYLGENRSVHLVSRLDRGTSGIIVLAKNGYSHDMLRNQLHTGEFQREYLAVVCNTPEKPFGEIELPIARGNGIKRIISADGVYAKTLYSVLLSNEKYSLIRLIPKTGRTHQLRVHMASIGWPLAGDWLYGKESEDISRCALHSAFLRIKHPFTKEKITVFAPLPSDMKKLIGCDIDESYFLQNGEYHER